MFRQLCDRFARSSDLGDYASASLETVRLLARLATDTHADHGVRDLLLGQTPIGASVGERALAIKAAEARRTAFDRVLELQQVPSVASLLRLADAGKAIAAGQGLAAPQIQILENDGAKLQPVEVPKTLNIRGKAKESLQRARGDKVQQVIAHFRQKSTKGKVNVRDLEKLNRELLVELAPQVRLALCGMVYAYYLRPEDLLVSEDPLLLRKHQFATLDSTLAHDKHSLPRT